MSSANLADLRKLDAGHGARIPLLKEVFALVPPGIGINVELKGAGTASVLAEWLPEAPDHSVLISSFDHGALREFGSIRKDYPLAPLFGRWKPEAPEIARTFGGGFINLSRKLITPPLLGEIHEAGLRSLVYTVNDIEEARRFFALGVWGVFTDYPDRITRETVGPGSGSAE